MLVFEQLNGLVFIFYLKEINVVVFIGYFDSIYD